MASKKLICVSDTHLACHDLLTPKLIDWYEADNDLIFIHAGDGCNSGSGRDVDKLFRWLESLPFKTKIYVPGNHDCLSNDTLVFTKRGWLTYNEITLNDEFLTLNVESNKQEWQKANEIIIKKYTGKLLNFKNDRLDFLVTPSHRVLNAGIYNPNKLRYTLSKDMCKSFVIPTGRKSENREFNLNDLEIKLIAWMLTDCSHTKSNLVFYQNIFDSFKIEEILIDLNIKFTKSIRQRDIKEICGKMLKNKTKPDASIYLSTNDTKNLQEKYNINNRLEIPEYVKNFSQRQFDLFIEELCFCDGGKYKTNLYSLYKPEHFLNSLINILPIFGYVFNLRNYRDKNYCLDFYKKEKVWFHMNKPTEIDYDDFVWCLNITNSNFLIKRNGYPLFTGNCSLDLNCTNIWWNRNNWKDNIKYTKDMLKEIAPSVTLLLNDVIILDGIIFGGVSRIPDLQQWAFYSTEEDNERFFQLLPKVDVLISHSPFQGFEATRYEFSGSRSMYEYLVNNNVNYFIHGHIHEGYGYRNIDRINCYNVAILNEHYSGCNEPTIIELIEKEIIL